MPDALLLTINGGSSSIKFAAFTPTAPPTRTLAGIVDRIGQPDAQLTATLPTGEKLTLPLPAQDHKAAATQLIDWLASTTQNAPVAGIGHRVVHGGIHLTDHQRVTPALIAELKRTQPLDLAHLPREIALIEAFHDAFPSLPQVACFDTVFHRTLPRVAQLLPIPRPYLDAGFRRFGFHGLSYTYLMSQLQTVDPIAADGRIILAHLGSGASMAAVHHGHPIDTTMAFTPTAGLVMGTRPGDLDPGLLVYLLRVENFTPDALDDFISHRCGMLGVSGTTADMRDLSTRRAGGDPYAADAINLFCHQAAKTLGALAVSLAGLDTLVFSGGIGEHAPDIRAQICANLAFLGIYLDTARNTANAPILSPDNAPVTVRLIPTDEESVIAVALLPFL